VDIDPKTAETARAKLHAFLDGNPPPEKAALARQALGMLPSPHAGMRPSSGSPTAEDEKLGISNFPENPGSTVGPAGWTKSELAPDQGQEARDEAAVSTSGRRPQTELEADPMLQEGIKQAMGMSALHMIGAAIGAPGRAILNSKGGRAAQLLKSTEAAGGDTGVFDPETIISSGSQKGKRAADAIEHLERLKANGANVERDLENAYNEAHGPSPDVEAAKAALKFRPPSAYESVHALHGNPIAIAGAGTHVLPPIMGALTVPAEIAAATGAGIAHPVSTFFMSPIMQAVMGAQTPDLPQQPGIPPGGTR
jgi:uncharacterized protein (UPF0335 family)